MSATADEAKRAEGNDFFQANIEAAAVGPPAAVPVDIESGKGGAALTGYDDGSSDRGTLSVLTFLKIVSMRVEYRLGQVAAVR